MFNVMSILTTIICIILCFVFISAWVVIMEFYRARARKMGEHFGRRIEDEENKSEDQNNESTMV